MLVTDVSKVSVGKADSWIGLLTIRTSIEGDRSILRCDSPKVRLEVTPRSEITKLIVPSLPHMRDQMFKKSHMGKSKLMHTTSSNSFHTLPEAGSIGDDARAAI